MIEHLPISVGIGLVVSLLLSEVFGLATGGMVVPGYVALYLTKPIDVALTVGAGFVTFVLVHSLSSIAIVYGRRRTVMMILVGYLIGAAVRSLITGRVEIVSHSEYTIIGFIIPGLIAIWMDRQGVVETIGALLTASVVVRLILILILGSEMHP